MIEIGTLRSRATPDERSLLESADIGRLPPHIAAWVEIARAIGADAALIALDHLSAGRTTIPSRAALLRDIHRAASERAIRALAASSVPVPAIAAAVQLSPRWVYELVGGKRRHRDSARAGNRCRTRAHNRTDLK